MSFTASGVGFSVWVGANPCCDHANQNNKQAKPVPMPQAKKYHDTFYVTEKKDYSYGTSPNGLRSEAVDGRGSPNRSPKL